jgi:HK97 family phage prohead protease
LEFKELELKAIDDKGSFQGIACKYNNVDSANDRLLKSAGKLNNNKEVPILYQHEVNDVIGKGTLSDGQEGIMLSAKLFLEKDDSGNMIFPLAHKAYELAKKGLLKLSIGYRTNDSQYKTEGGKTVRELKDIEVMETSMVLFACNEKAVITSVKQEGGNKVEEKAMGFADLLKVQQANDMRWKLQDALNMSFRALMEDDTMTIEQKITQLGANVDEFATAYKENMNLLLQASAKNKVAKKEVFDILEKKEAAELETKAGKKISKLSMEKIKSAISALSGLIDNVEIEEEDDKGCGTKTGMKESTVVVETKQEPNKDDIIELKSEELDEISKLYKTIKGGNK